jgi:hypothetical protein
MDVAAALMYGFGANRVGEDSYGFGPGGASALGGPAFSSYDTGPIDVSDGSTVTINVVFFTNPERP